MSIHSVDVFVDKDDDLKLKDNRAKDTTWPFVLSIGGVAFFMSTENARKLLAVLRPVEDD